MLCYLDRTFCKYWTECHVGEGCKRALTPEVLKGATNLNLPVSGFADIPPCFVVKDYPHVVPEEGVPVEALVD